jgi:hypothetical protein
MPSSTAAFVMFVFVFVSWTALVGLLSGMVVLVRPMRSSFDHSGGHSFLV